MQCFLLWPIGWIAPSSNTPATYSPDWAAHVGSIYFSPAEKREKNRFSRKTWTLLVIAFLALAALLAWWLEGRLW
ncbi:MAG: hypothetical protein K2L60_01665 [Bacteroides sp.]|nr:hypothetical protein [Bacteroides sp.]